MQNVPRNLSFMSRISSIKFSASFCPSCFPILESENNRTAIGSHNDVMDLLIPRELMGNQFKN